MVWKEKVSITGRNQVHVRTVPFYDDTSVGFITDFSHSCTMEKLKGLDLEGKKILDAGTGGCNMTKYLEDWGAEIVSIDVREDWQKDCKDMTKHSEFITGDLTDMGFIKAGMFDYVVCNFVVSALSQNKGLLISSALREFYRVLKEAGMLVIIDYYPFESESCPGPCDNIQVELWRLENTVSEMLGKGHLEEYPPAILEKELKAIGFSESESSILLQEVPWPIDLFKEHEETIKEDIDRIEEDYLRDALLKKLDDIMKKARGSVIRSGSIYELRAKK